MVTFHKSSLIFPAVAVVFQLNAEPWTHTIETNHGSTGQFSVPSILTASTSSTTSTIAGVSYPPPAGAIPMIEDTMLGYYYSAAPATDPGRPAIVSQRKP